MVCITDGRVGQMLAEQTRIITDRIKNEYDFHFDFNSKGGTSFWPLVTVYVSPDCSGFE